MRNIQPFQFEPDHVEIQGNAEMTSGNEDGDQTDEANPKWDSMLRKAPVYNSSKTQNILKCNRKLCYKDK